MESDVRSRNVIVDIRIGKKYRFLFMFLNIGILDYINFKFFYFIKCGLVELGFIVNMYNG